MAYAELASVPPQAGLIPYTMFGTSRQLVVAVMSAATVGDLAPRGSAEFMALTAALDMLVGVLENVQQGPPVLASTQQAILDVPPDVPLGT